MDLLADAIAAMRVGTPHSTRTQVRAPWGQRFPPQDGAGFHVVLRGSCWLTPARGAPIRLQVGDVAFLPREMGHAIGDRPGGPPWNGTERAVLDTGRTAAGTPSEDASTTVLLCGAYRLDQSRAHPLLSELPDVIHLPARIGHHTALRGAIDLLGLELDTRNHSGVIAPLLEVLLQYMLRAWYDDQPEDTGWAGALRDPALYAALAAMHREPAAPWTVRSLGAVGGLSRSVFAQRFTAVIGTAPQTYLTWWRMTLAARMLRDTDALVRVVAERCGYTSEFAFAKAFKREFGVAPGRYRNSATSTENGDGRSGEQDQPSA
ncbi:AraC family transcriptional regulator [Nocardia sp. NBC_01503]|uniref:AraC family transcriptional regulator n=1 Tax=Nocardia sp. NBC_01503 TaxID=2975997 RepID=UPI002E7AE789|nr:AraC family transcriptional regulator [Nocardia sp. NBC_01503]WTL31084.1 AraC family transcriptional regulator [Nocardia sp. NBC_01503]